MRPIASHFDRWRLAGALALVGTWWCGVLNSRAADLADTNSGYELIGGIEQWETTVLLGGDLELTGHIEPMWEGGQHVDDQSCEDGAISTSSAIHDGQVQAVVEHSRRRAAPSADAIIELVRMWGVCPTASCAPDLTGDGLVETADLMQLLFGVNQ